MSEVDLSAEIIEYEDTGGDGSVLVLVASATLPSPASKVQPRGYV